MLPTTQTSRSLASPPPVIHPSRSDEPSRRDAAGERLLRRRPPPQMGDERVKAEALQILGLFQALPRLVVFDLDYTLWPFYWYPISSLSHLAFFRSSIEEKLERF